MSANRTRGSGSTETSERSVTVTSNRSSITLWPQANLAHPVLRVSPTFGEAMRGNAKTPTAGTGAGFLDAEYICGELARDS